MVAQIPPIGAAATLQAGQPYPLGAHCDGGGVNFALFSEHAERVELCLFDAQGTREVARLPLPCCSDQVWHGYLPAAGAGLVYGYRVHGPRDPARGHRFSPRHLLLDPYAREVVGHFDWHPAHFDLAQPGLAELDNAPWALKARVCDDRYDWQDDRPPQRPLADTVLYEAHVRGLTRLHPAVPPALRGCYAGLAEPAVIAHLCRLGVTAVNLLPVQYALDEQRLVRAGLRNYWGYNTLAYFAPDPRLSAARDGRGQRDEFRRMVAALHAAQIEVILDVVYNHTAETDHLGPTLSFRGIDNASWYRLDPRDPTRYLNFTGCGNTVNFSHPRVLQWAMDSLRYWVTEMHVDGFRFDLAVTLGRESTGFDPGSAFFDAVRQDPVLNRVKLIAEPWDVGPDGYQAGAFPVGWSEWNGRFRDGLRAFWLGHRASRGELARRMCGSSELFRPGRRAPQAGINFLTAHDGFTLADLVSYRDKHNQANGENNRDGHDDNLSCNCGAEGPSADPAILAARGLRVRALLACLALAQGVPQLLAGDELGHSQQGNNNAYCQDNALTWLDWARAEPALGAYLERLFALRRRWPQFRQRRWLEGSPPGRPDVRWQDADGAELGPQAWDDPEGSGLAMQLADPDGGADSVLLLFSRAAGAETFRLPAGRWTVLLDSGHFDAEAASPSVPSEPGAVYCLNGPAVAVLAATAA